MHTVTTDEAIKRGRKILFVGPAIVCFVCIAVCMAGMFTFKSGDKLKLVWVFSTMAFALISPVIIYLRLLPGWRIWALSNVKNVHEFKRMAILSQIYREDNSKWWRYELATQNQKEKLLALADRFNEPDIFEDDPDIPHETAYSYSKAEIAGFAIVAVLLLSLGFGMLLLPKKKYPLCAIVIAGASFFAYQAYKRWSAHGPQLTVNDDGIATAKNGFHSWGEITNEQVTWVKAGESYNFNLGYTVNHTLISISLGDLMGVHGYKLDPVLRVYRHRYEAKRNRC